MVNYELLHMGSDCTGPYKVTFSRPMTVGKFIEEILATYPDEWGYIDIYITKNKKIARCEYSHGLPIKYDKLELKMHVFSDMEEDVLLTKEIKDVKGRGGWTRSDYDVYI